MKIELKGITGIIAAIIVVVGAVFYVLHRRASLREQGLPQVEQYVESEISRQVLAERKGRYLKPEEIARMRDFEITEFRAPFIPGNKTRARVVVRTGRGDKTYHFKFERVLGSWRLERETIPGLFTGW